MHSSVKVMANVDSGEGVLDKAEVFFFAGRLFFFQLQLIRVTALNNRLQNTTRCCSFFLASNTQSDTSLDTHQQQPFDCNHVLRRN